MVRAPGVEFVCALVSVALGVALTARALFTPGLQVDIAMGGGALLAFGVDWLKEVRSW